MGSDVSKGEYKVSNHMKIKELLSEHISLDLAVTLILRYTTTRTVLLGSTFDDNRFALEKQLGESNIGFYFAMPSTITRWPETAPFGIIRSPVTGYPAFSLADAIVLGDPYSIPDEIICKDVREWILDTWSKYKMPIVHRDANGISWVKHKVTNRYTALIDEDDWGSTLLTNYNRVAIHYSKEKEEARRESYGADVRAQCYLCQQQQITCPNYTKVVHGNCKSCTRYVCGNHLASSNQLCDECDQDNEEYLHPQQKRRRVTRFPLKTN